MRNNYIEWENPKHNEVNSQKKWRETPAKTKIDRYRWSHPKSNQDTS